MTVPVRGFINRTLEILSYPPPPNNRIHIIKGEKNIGFINGYFETLDSCGDADYYAYLDSDDTWPENKIEIAIKALEKENKDIPILWCSKYNICDERLNFLCLSPNVCQISFRNSLVDIVGLASTYVFNAKAREILLKNLPRHAVGQDMCIYMLCQGLGKVLFDPRPLMNYRRHGGNISASTKNRIAFLIWRLKHFLIDGEIKNIRAQMQEYSDFYAFQLNEEDRRILELFTKRNIVTAIKKLFYSHMFRQNIPDEIMLRCLFLLGLL